jgi:hypothetical protein
VNADGVFCHARGLGNFESIHVFHKTKQKNGALTIGQIFRRIPTPSVPFRRPVPLASGDIVLSGSQLPISAESTRRTLHLSPELEPSIPNEFPDAIESDLHQPGSSGSIRPRNESLYL